MLVNAGLPAMWKMTVAAIRGLGHSPRDITALVLTHAHFDHLGFAARLQHDLDVPVYCHPGDYYIAAHPYRYKHEKSRLLYPVKYPRCIPILGRMTAAGALIVKGVNKLRPLDGGAAASLPGSARGGAHPGTYCRSLRAAFPGARHRHQRRRTGDTRCLRRCPRAAHRGGSGHCGHPASPRFAHWLGANGCTNRAAGPRRAVRRRRCFRGAGSHRPRTVLTAGSGPSRKGLDVQFGVHPAEGLCQPGREQHKFDHLHPAVVRQDLADATAGDGLRLPAVHAGADRREGQRLGAQLVGGPQRFAEASGLAPPDRSGPRVGWVPPCGSPIWPAGSAPRWRPPAQPSQSGNSVARSRRHA